ncbi:lysozyme inhibitor LprI family protein [Burkholderia vietnamiensis]|uniref:lysozyme inhibitor LprI family protein n=1 Tax=Burkholderia vietnamiensis TaxID=60552 RepID=UPI001CF23D79|nr:lysozyme inhibitor LprI family protein [Burkholderia vietnamiensis]MCA8291873.1 lysozyme inhibitor LprI family protein [Burkholderia vietnamiensis]
MTIGSKLAPVALLLAVLATRDAHAVPDCANLQDQRAMNECASRGYARVDAELNRRYRALQRRLKGDRDGARKLTEVQRAWIAFRDTECAFQTTGVVGGSAEPLARAACLEETTHSRSAVLQRYLDCHEGDTNCPVAAQ